MNNSELKKRYGNFSSLLIYFLLDTYLDPEKVSDLNTIKKYITEGISGDTFKTIQQGREILALTNFPDEWISNTANRYCKDKQAYKEWVMWIVETLEQEAKKQGKL